MDLLLIFLFDVVLRVVQRALQNAFENVLHAQFVHAIENVFVVQEKRFHRLFEMIEMKIETGRQ